VKTRQELVRNQEVGGSIPPRSTNLPPTDGYTVLNFHGTYQLTTGSTVHTVTRRVDNAADEIYRNHLSYIKEIAPEMRRSIKLVYGVRF
jgi:iron complex outermembrane receptor protein